MNKILLNLMLSIIMILSTFTLSGCLGDDPADPPDYNADIEQVLPENIDTEHFVVEEGETYYTSPGFYLSMSVRGHFMIMDYFTLDGDKRIYDNIYFYENDYYYIVTDDYKDLYASLQNSSDYEYAEEEKQSGEDIQLNIVKSGIYKLIFDTKTLKFDMEYKSAITTPKYYTIPNCDIFTVATSWVEMSKNPLNQEEFYISNFHVDTGKDINFFSHIHTSNFVPTLHTDSLKYGSVRKTNITILIGGNYNVYINSKTYEVRLELTNPDTADYSCVYYDGSDFINLSLLDSNVPYVFTYTINITSKYTSVPSFYSKCYKEYTLTTLSSPHVMSKSFITTGTFKLNINLKTFELSVELMPE